MDKIFDFLIKHELLGSIVGSILFFIIPVGVLFNLGKIKDFIKKKLSIAEEKSPAFTRYFLQPLVWALAILILAPIAILGALMLYQFIRVRSAAIQGY
jgi:hypothetical protein